MFPDDPDVLFLVASAHEYFAGVRTQSVMRSIKAPRDVTFDVLEENAELRLAEQLYKRALERNGKLVEARIRLGRVLGLRGRHEEAIAQLRQAQVVEEPLLQFYMQLFLGGSSRRSVMELRPASRMNGRRSFRRPRSLRCWA